MLAAAQEAGTDGKIAGLDSWYDGASFVRWAQVPAIAFGPPSLHNAHAVDESVAIDDLVVTAQALALAAIRWFSV
jgi:acetylornithine deacetylase/succinyl-diaminopimelate desuccinylase-like protein